MSAFSKHGHDAYLCKPPAARHVEHAMAGRQEGYKRVALAHVAAMGAWPGRWGVCAYHAERVVLCATLDGRSQPSAVAVCQPRMAQVQVWG